MTKRERMTRTMRAVVDADDKYPVAAWGLGVLLIVGGLLKLEGVPLYIAVTIGVCAIPPLKRSVLGLVEGIAPFVLSWKRGPSSGPTSDERQP